MEALFQNEVTKGESMNQKKIILNESEMPTQWYNVIPDIPNGLQPPLDPETKQPIAPEKLAAVFPMGF